MLNPIVIIAHNNLALTKRAVASALAQDIGGLRVVLVDNASTDGTEQWWMAQPFDVLGTMCYLRQVSLAKCWNDALACMLQLSDHCLIVNNDTELLPETYRLLRDHGNGYLTSGISVRTHDELTLPPIVNKPTPNPLYSSSPHPDFSCFLITKRVIEKVGWFDEAMYPAFYEDNDYHVRMHRAGIEAVSINIPFLHHGSATIKQADSREREVIERGAAKNKERFRQKYGCVPGTPEYDLLFASIVPEKNISPYADSEPPSEP